MSMNIASIHSKWVQGKSEGTDLIQICRALSIDIEYNTEET